MRNLQRSNSLPAVAACLIAAVAAYSASKPRSSTPLPAAKAPNFVVVYAEGMGWTGTSVQMDDRLPGSKSSFVRTPNLERLAQQGMRFAAFYAPSPRCTPSRATLFTGKTPALLRMTYVGQGRGENEDAGRTAEPGRKLIPPRALLELPERETTIGELLKSAGYATASFGKWHVGRVSPSRHGFDENDGATGNGGPENSDHPNPKEAFGMAERGIAFMIRQVKAGKPFYLQLSQYPGRGGDDALKETYETVRKRLGDADDRRTGVAAVTQDMDTTIGMVLAKIDQLDIAGNTYVLYTADHGAGGRNEPLNAGKGHLWEGGIRVPLIIRGPGIRPGTLSLTRATQADLFPTFAELARVHERMPAGIEGGSLVPVLTNDGAGEVKRPREELVFHFPHYDLGNSGPATAIMLGNFKLIRVYEDGSLHLYDLSRDVAEQHNLAGEMPDKAAELQRRMDDYLQSVNAQMPALNPNYDPNSQAPDAKRDRKGRGRKRPG